MLFRTVCTCSHCYVTITLILTLTVLSYPDEIAVRRKTSKKDYFSVLVFT